MKFQRKMNSVILTFI